jgi:outer membrane protein, heavy metal efflux system
MAPDDMRQSSGRFRAAGFARGACALAVLAVLTCAGSSEEELPAGATLSVLQDWAVAHNSGLKAEEARVRAAVERIPQAGSLPDPQLGYSVEDMRVSGDLIRHRAEITQVIPLFGKLGLQTQEARTEAEIASRKYEGMRLNVRSMVSEAYAEYCYRLRAVTVTEENMRLLSSIEETVRAAYEAGKESQSPVIRLQIELGMLDESLRSARDALEPARARLNALLNIPPEQPLSVSETLPDRTIALSDDDLLRRVLDGNPELQALKLETAARETEAKLADLQSRPDIMLGINAGNTGMAMDNAYSLMGMISVNLPVRDARNRAAVSEADAIERSAAGDLGERGNALTAELKSELFSWRDANRKIELTRDTLIPKARQALAVTRQSFEAGGASYTDLIDSLRLLLELELSLERSLADRVSEYDRIAALAGSRSLDNAQK